MMSKSSAQASANPNIAFIKYWGNLDDALRIPANGSISMTLGNLTTTTRVSLDNTLKNDQFILNGSPASQAAQNRVSAHLDLIRLQSKEHRFAFVESENNFPAGAGIASSASAFAALTVAAASAAGLDLDSTALSRIARRGSGSAARSLFGGFVELVTGPEDADSYAIQFANAGHWELVDLIAITDSAHKATGSTRGHQSAASSPLQSARVEHASMRVQRCRQAILERNFGQLASVAELDSNLMHAVMITSQPPLLYWNPGSIAVMRRIPELRSEGLDVFFTVDAGPNVHYITTAADADAAENQISAIPGVRRFLRAPVGVAPHIT